MKLILIIVCLLLLFYHFESNQLMFRNINEHLVVVWKLRNKKILLHIFPHDQHVLIDDNNFYLYLGKNMIETYVPAIQLGSNVKRSIINYTYLWSDEFPRIMSYPKDKEHVVDILNHIS